jgi:glycosyltransferase involved in cell wall biosynthesis
MPEKRKLGFTWRVSDYTGWGVYGFNLLVHGYKSSNFQMLLGQDPSFLYPLDPLTDKYLTLHLSGSGNFLDLQSDDILLTALGNSNASMSPKKHRNIGVIFCETSPLPEAEVKTLKEFEFIITGSTWNASSLKSLGIETRTVIQGVDLDIFTPHPKRYLEDRFVVFSGGKLEFRKGQDLVLRAFSVFSKKHADALLINAWRSPWEQHIAASINRSQLCEPFFPSPDIGKSIDDWIFRNNVRLENVISLGPTPNRLMPEVFREVDLAVFPNRCEGGTNLVAMEALAYGLTSIISENTGHLDIIKDDNCIPLRQITSAAREQGECGWGESSVDDLVDLMEEAYHGKRVQPSKARGSMMQHSWKNAINSLLTLL